MIKPGYYLVEILNLCRTKGPVNRIRDLLWSSRIEQIQNVFGLGGDSIGWNEISRERIPYDLASRRIGTRGQRIKDGWACGQIAGSLGVRGENGTIR